MDLFADQPYMGWMGNSRLSFWSNLVSLSLSALFSILLFAGFFLILHLLVGAGVINLAGALVLQLCVAFGCGWVTMRLASAINLQFGKRLVSDSNLFPTYSAWMVWWTSLPTLSTTTAVNAKLLRLMQSKDRQEVVSAIEYTKQQGTFDLFSQQSLLGSFSSGNFQSVPMWEELVDAGAYLMRFDRDYNPLTFMALSGNALLPELLDKFLARGAQINDRNLDGDSLLDKFVSSQKMFHSSIDIDEQVLVDLDVLLARGAVVLPRTVKAMEKLMESPRSASYPIRQKMLSRLKAHLSRSTLLDVAGISSGSSLPPEPELPKI